MEQPPHNVKIKIYNMIYQRRVIIMLHGECVINKFI